MLAKLKAIVKRSFETIPAELLRLRRLYSFASWWYQSFRNDVVSESEIDECFVGNSLLLRALYPPREVRRSVDNLVRAGLVEEVGEMSWFEGADLVEEKLYRLREDWEERMERLARASGYSLEDLKS